ncbi:MAG: hypothetical protein L6U99_02460 [Clostridium sp.]|nr:MAG: hypothetical protein L6U99_02460 [Clostridium sp.]
MLSIIKNLKIHNKEREVFDSYDHMKWGCGRILPQGLNESIIAIRMIQAIEIVKEDIDKEFKDFVYKKIYLRKFIIYYVLRLMQFIIFVVGIFRQLG